MNQDSREKIAAAVHESWAHWMDHLFRQCESDGSGGMVIPAQLVERWQRQIETPYDALSVEEQALDLKEADRILKAVGQQI